MKKIIINSKCPYTVFVGKNFIFRFGEILKDITKSNCRIFIVTDELVYKLYGKILEENLKKVGFLTSFFILENKEESKNFRNILIAYELLFRFQISKKDLILAFGGGMVCDFSGFLAATYKRGIRVINFPTTLLSLVDAAVGGKNAINLEFGKNLVGTIRSPFLVFCDVSLVDSLSKRDFSSGVAEIIKYAVCFSPHLFRILVEEKIDTLLEEVVFRSIKIKKEVVENDEFEDNVRMKLNFGHTVGHALEKYYNFNMLHGEAVSIGMVYITKSSYKAGITDFDDFLRLRFILRRFNLKTTTDVPFEDIFKNILADKKIYGDNISFCVIEKIGKSKIIDLPIKKFKKFLEL